MTPPLTALLALPIAAGLGMIAAPLIVLGPASATATTANGIVPCAGGGTGQRIAGVPLDAEQLGNAATEVTVAAHRHLPVLAAVIAVTTSYTESGLRNTVTETDHDSEGLFQQRVSIYTAAVADDPVRATNAFLDRLITVPGWQQNPAGLNAQAVQHSEFPQRYEVNTNLAAGIVGRYWPTATAKSSEGSDRSPVCAGGAGATPIIGPTGSNVAGTTTIPPGLVRTGSPRARVAIAFALAQLGKRYVFGAAGPDAWDCSGLTMAAWAAAGTTLAHWAGAQVTAGTPEPTDLSQAVGGDLVLIPGSDGTVQSPGHVGMIVGYLPTLTGRHLYLIQAPETGIPVELTEATEWTGQIAAVRHIH